MTLWYELFDFPGVYNNVRYLLLGGKSKIFKHLRTALEVRDGETFLDLGCGPGEMSQLFNTGYVGMDISQRYINYSSKKYPDKKFILGDAFNFISQKFDKVLLSCFIHHCSDEQLSELLLNLKLVVKKKLIILDAVPQNRNVVANLLYKLDRGANIRSLDEQLSFIKKFFEVESYYTFYSLFYKLSVIIAKPKNLKE